MGRLERNVRRRARRRAMFFSLLAIMLLFLAGIKITNSVMVQMTGLPPEKDILSSQNMELYMEKIKGIKIETQWIADLKVGIVSWAHRIQKTLERLINRI
mgnify:CR=1 FL=1